MLDVADVPVSPSSVVTELCEVSPCCSDWEFVEPQSFSFSKKRAHCCTDTQEEISYEGSPVKESASHNEKKDDTAYTYATFVHLLQEGAGKLRRRRKRIECERKNNHRKNDTVFGKKLQCEGEG